MAAKTAKNVSMRTAMARFPFVKPLETFDFAYQPSIDKRQVQTLASCHYIEHGDNVIVLGPPGVGNRPQTLALLPQYPNFHTSLQYQHRLLLRRRRRRSVSRSMYQDSISTLYQFTGSANTATSAGR